MKYTENCPFCNILKDEREILSETKDSFIILSNPTLVSGHCLVIPKKHVKKPFRLKQINLLEQTTLLKKELPTKFQLNKLKDFILK